MTYFSSLQYLDSLTNFETLRNPSSRRFFRLERMEKFLKCCDSPHKKFKSILIAGTKGKGSTAAILESLVRHSGYRVALYTSPHLSDVRERIQINRKMISEEKFAYYMQRFKKIIETSFKGEEKPTYFELLTLLSFCYFADEKVDLTVVEVGMGGRLDATNVLKPLISILTSVSFDHQAFLGNMLSQIAEEKIAIVKNKSWLVCADQENDVKEVVLRRVKNQRARAWILGRNFKSELKQVDLDATHFKFQSVSLKVSLTGAHQAQNAALAVQAALLLKRRGFHRISFSSIKRGLENVHWPLRFETLQKGKQVWIVDGAHNGDSAERLTQTVKRFFKKPVRLIVGGSSDKDWPRIFKHLKPLSRQVTLTQSHHPRAVETNQLSQTAKTYFKTVRQSTLEEALKPNGNCVTVVTGSLFVAQEAKNRLTRLYGAHC